jgi:MFS transporter, DHA1 family, multidrug resistance protein
VTWARDSARWRMLAVLGALSAFGPLSMDMYLPSTPAIAADLHTGQALVQFTLSGCVAGLAAGQLVAGPLSDRLGRRRPLLAGLVAFVLLSAACAAAPDVAVLIVLRFGQGMAGAAGIVLSTAIVRDLYDARDTARILASLTLVSGLAPVLAPLAGAQLLRVTGWRGVFGVLAGIGLALLAGGWSLPETLPPARRSPGRLGGTLAASLRLLRDREFAGNAAVVTLSMTALLTYISSVPFIVEDFYRRSPQVFSLVFAANALGLMAVGQASAALVRRVAPAVLLRAALAGQAVGAAGLIMAAALGHPPMLVLLLPMSVVVAAVGMVRPNGMALALAGQAAVAGTASAFLGAMQFMSGAVIAPLGGAGGRGQAAPAALVIGTVCLAAFALNLALARARPGAWPAAAGDAPAAGGGLPE